MIHVTTLLADISPPDPLVLNPDGQRPVVTSAHMAPAFIALAVFALALVAYLVWDFCRQKRAERKNLLRLQRFRENQRKQGADAPTLNREKQTPQG